MPVLWQISKWCLDINVPQCNSGIRRRVHPPHGPSIQVSLQHHYLWKSSPFHHASLVVPPCLKLNTTCETLLIETLCYHITFSSTLLQPKIAFIFDSLYQMFSLSYPQWHLISWVTTNHFQLKLLFPYAYEVFNMLLYHCVESPSLVPLTSETYHIFIKLNKVLSARFMSELLQSLFHHLKKKTWFFLNISQDRSMCYQFSSSCFLTSYKISSDLYPLACWIVNWGDFCQSPYSGDGICTITTSPCLSRKKGDTTLVE